MRNEVKDIVNDFNNKLCKVDADKLHLYMVLLDYRQKVCHVIRDNKDDCFDTIERLNNEYFELFKKSSMYDSKISNFDELMDYICEQTKEIEKHLLECKNKIKEFYSNNNISLTSIVPGVYDSLKKSKNILNQYEREIGDWVFASSEDVDKNVYRLRVSSSGMYRISENTYIIWGNHLEECEGQLIVNKPSYLYELKSDKFMPVVSLGRSENGSFCILFGDEWTSDRNLVQEDILSINQIQNVTDVLKSSNILSVSDSNVIEEIRKTLNNKALTQQEKEKVIEAYVYSGIVVDWNKRLQIASNTTSAIPEK